LSASLRQQTTVRDVLPSVHSPVTRSMWRGVQATRIVTFGAPEVVVQKLGCVATYPVRLTCASLAIVHPPESLLRRGALRAPRRRQRHGAAWLLTTLADPAPAGRAPAVACGQPASGAAVVDGGSR
jgi:hypothetical protein